MTPSQIAADPERLEAVTTACLGPLTRILDGLPTYSDGAAAMFVGFLTACRLAGVDPGHQFEAILATVEVRKAATHRATGTLN